MKDTMKHSIKYAALKFGWFIATAWPASNLFVQFEILSIEAISVFFLGVSAYMFGVEIIEQKERKT